VPLWFVFLSAQSPDFAALCARSPTCKKFNQAAYKFSFYKLFVILLFNKVYMPYDIKELLKLPDEEKIAIADLLYTSVNDDFEENENLTPWYEDEEFLNELDKRSKDLREGKVKGYTLEEVKSLMKEHKANYKRK